MAAIAGKITLSEAVWKRKNAQFLANAGNEKLAGRSPMALCGRTDGYGGFSGAERWSFPERPLRRAMEMPRIPLRG